MSNAIDGWGTTLVINSTNILEVDKVSIPGAKAKVINVSHLQSPSAWEEFISGMVDAGEVTFDCNFLPAQGLTMRNFFRANVPVVLTLPTGTLVFFQAFLSSWGLEVPKDDRISQPFTFKITGKISYTP
jgi:hypothetical protein